MSDIPNDAMAETSSILPYDFVKQNNIFGIDNNGEIKICLLYTSDAADE